MARLSTWTILRTGVGRDGAERGELIEAVQLIARGKVDAVRKAHEITGAPDIAHEETARRGSFRVRSRAS